MSISNLSGVSNIPVDLPNLNVVNSITNNSPANQLNDFSFTPLALHAIALGAAQLAPPTAEEIKPFGSIINILQASQSPLLKTLSYLGGRIDTQEASLPAQPEENLMIQGPIGEKEKIELLKLGEAEFDKMSLKQLQNTQVKLFDVGDQELDNITFDGLLEPYPRTNVRCLTWITSPTIPGDNGVLAPYFIADLQEKIYVAEYNIWKGSTFEDGTLKVVAGRYQVDLPFHLDLIQMPDNTLIKVAVVVRPIIQQQLNTAPTTVVTLNGPQEPNADEPQEPEAVDPKERDEDPQGPDPLGVRVVLFARLPTEEELQSMRKAKQVSE